LYDLSDLIKIEDINNNLPQQLVVGRTGENYAVVAFSFCVIQGALNESEKKKKYSTCKDNVLIFLSNCSFS